MIKGELSIVHTESLVSCEHTTNSTRFAMKHSNHPSVLPKQELPTKGSLKSHMSGNKHSSLSSTSDRDIIVVHKQAGILKIHHVNRKITRSRELLPYQVKRCEHRIILPTSASPFIHISCHHVPLRCWLVRDRHQINLGPASVSHVITSVSGYVSPLSPTLTLEIVPYSQQKGRWLLQTSSKQALSHHLRICSHNSILLAIWIENEIPIVLILYLVIQTA